MATDQQFKKLFSGNFQKFSFTFLLFFKLPLLNNCLHTYKRKVPLKNFLHDLDVLSIVEVEQNFSNINLSIVKFAYSCLKVKSIEEKSPPYIRIKFLFFIFNCNIISWTFEFNSENLVCNFDL